MPDIRNIIDTLNRFSASADEILDAGNIQPDAAFNGIKHFLGTYIDSPESSTVPLDRQTLQDCKQSLATGEGDYYAAMEFLDIDLEPIRNLAEYLEEESLADEAELLWAVVDAVDEIRQWVNRQTDPAPEQPYTKHRRQQQNNHQALSQEEFLALFDPKTCKPHKARLLLDHILEVSGEKNVHTYYGALAAQSQNWFKNSERDFASLLRHFLSVAGLDPSLAGNIRQTKLGAKVLTRAKEKLNEISRSRARQ